LEILPAAFTDHHAVVLRINLDIPHTSRGKGLWTLNNQLLSGEEIQARIDGGLPNIDR
jgi:hypothetical protein